jgi:hypothetical protein
MGHVLGLDPTQNFHIDELSFSFARKSTISLKKNLKQGKQIDKVG